MIITGLGPKTVIRQIGRINTCEELKRELKACRIVSCGGHSLEDDHTFVEKEVIQVLGRIKGGMEVNSYSKGSECT